MKKIVDPPRPASQVYPPDPIPRILLGGSVNLFAGAPGVGKTAFLAWMLTQLRDGKPIFGQQPNRLPKIAILSIDRSWHQSSQLWFELAGFPEIPHYCLQDDDDFDIDRLATTKVRMVILREVLDKLGDLPFGSLVVIDPIAPFLGGNLLDYDACMVACSRIRRECRKRGITILGVSHAGKQKNDAKAQYRRLQDRIIGSAAQFGYTDTQMYLASPDETGEKFYTFLWNPHHAPAETFQLGRGDDGLFVPWDTAPTLEETRRVLAQIPATAEGVSWGALLKGTQLPKSTLHRVLVDYIDNNVVERVHHGHYRRLYDNHYGTH